MKKVILATLATIMFYNQMGYALTMTWDNMGSRITITGDTSNSIDRAENSSQNFELNAEIPAKIQEIIAIEALDIPFSEKNKVISEKLSELSQEELSILLSAIKSKNQEINHELDKAEKNGSIQSLEVLRKLMVGISATLGLITASYAKTAWLTPYTSQAQIAIVEAGDKVHQFGFFFVAVGGLTFMLSASMDKKENARLTDSQMKEMKSEIANLRVLSAQVSGQLSAMIAELHAKQLAE